MTELFSYAFFRNALVAAFVLSLLFSILSFIVVSRRLSAIVIGTEHAAFGTAGLAYLLGIPSFPVTFVLCILITSITGLRSRNAPDSSINLLFTTVMAGGTLLLSYAAQMGRSGGFNLTAFLFGNLLGINTGFLIFTIAVATLILGLVLPALGKILYLSFDHDGAFVAGASTVFWDLVVYASLSAALVLGMRLVGVLLIAALAILPASFSLLWSKGLKQSVWISFLFTLFIFYGGITLSVLYDLPPGATVVALGAVIYFVAQLILGIKKRR
ncbi:MAG: metal ABC transporter permease [Brevinema sp.]